VSATELAVLADTTATAEAGKSHHGGITQPAARIERCRLSSITNEGKLISRDFHDCSDGARLRLIL